MKEKYKIKKRTTLAYTKRKKL